LIKYALGFPEAWEDHPWGENVAKVGKKVFVFLGTPEQEGMAVCAKLPDSAAFALTFPFSEPAGYGLGRAGWVLARFGPTDEVPVADGDPTGCGDVFGATAVASVLAGAGLEDALRLGTRMGARNVSHHGATGLRDHLRGKLSTV
jgi:sugar/nucleoside kinase (ribokinase family)